MVDLSHDFCCNDEAIPKYVSCLEHIEIEPRTTRLAVVIQTCTCIALFNIEAIYVLHSTTTLLVLLEG